MEIVAEFVVGLWPSSTITTKPEQVTQNPFEAGTDRVWRTTRSVKGSNSIWQTFGLFSSNSNPTESTLATTSQYDQVTKNDNQAKPSEELTTISTIEVPNEGSLDKKNGTSLWKQIYKFLHIHYQNEDSNEQSKTEKVEDVNNQNMEDTEDHESSTKMAKSENAELWNKIDDFLSNSRIRESKSQFEDNIVVQEYSEIRYLQYFEPKLPP